MSCERFNSIFRSVTLTTSHRMKTFQYRRRNGEEDKTSWAHVNCNATVIDPLPMNGSTFISNVRLDCLWSSVFLCIFRICRYQNQSLHSCNRIEKQTFRLWFNIWWFNFQCLGNCKELSSTNEFICFEQSMRCFHYFWTDEIQWGVLNKESWIVMLNIGRAREIWIISNGTFIWIK